MQQFQTSLLWKKWHKTSSSLVQEHRGVGKSSLLPTKRGSGKTWHEARQEATLLGQDMILVPKCLTILNIAVYLTHDPVSSLDQCFNTRSTMHSSGHKFLIFCLHLHGLPSAYTVWQLSSRTEAIKNHTKKIKKYLLIPSLNIVPARFRKAFTSFIQGIGCPRKHFFPYRLQFSRHSLESRPFPRNSFLFLVISFIILVSIFSDRLAMLSVSKL
jgi:hypothetical protein